jgi:hypothetical protein
MRPSTLFVVVLLAVTAPVVVAFAADEVPPPLPPPPETSAADDSSKPLPPPPGSDVKPSKPTPTAEPSAVLTQEQIQALFDAGNYNDTLKAIARVLPLKGKAAEPYDRYKLTLLKAETHVRMKMQGPAVQAFNDAADETDEESAKYAAKATAQLLKKSKGFVFTPKPLKRTGKPPASLDLTDPVARKAALQAMLDEEMARVVPKVKGALEESSLPPIASAIEAAVDVRELEIGVTGADANSKAMVSDLGVRGRELITKTIEKMSKRVDEITKDANETVRIRIPVSSVRGASSVQERVHRRGLKNGEDRELRQVIAQLPPIAKSAQELVAEIGGKKSEAEQIVEMCSELSRRAKKTLEADYTSSF